ncbi:MAG: hypothetical protein Q8S43_11215, partial [Actinomycetota bacterium]|nr:hypothetical protein [Actinomycetota bacterium]
MDYRGIFTPLAQPHGPWRGQSFPGAKQPQTPPTPAILRAHIFFDGQNLFRAVKSRLGYTYPNYDPVALSHFVCSRLNLRCDGIHFYTTLSLYHVSKG